MTEITKTIQIYKPEEKLPAIGCNYIAIIKPYKFESDGEKFHIPYTTCYGTINNHGIFCLVDSDFGTLTISESEFMDQVYEWYYLPC